MAIAPEKPGVGRDPKAFFSKNSRKSQVFSNVCRFKYGMLSPISAKTRLATATIKYKYNTPSTAPMQPPKSELSGPTTGMRRSPEKQREIILVTNMKAEKNSRKKRWKKGQCR